MADRRLHRYALSNLSATTPMEHATMCLLAYGFLQLEPLRVSRVPRRWLAETRFGFDCRRGPASLRQPAPGHYSAMDTCLRLNGRN